LALMVVVVALMVVVVVVVMVSPESLFRTSSARVTHGRSPALYVRTSFPTLSDEASPHVLDRRGFLL
jgi:hypothetical protein